MQPGPDETSHSKGYFIWNAFYICLWKYLFGIFYWTPQILTNTNISIIETIDRNWSPNRYWNENFGNLYNGKQCKIIEVSNPRICLGYMANEVQLLNCTILDNSNLKSMYKKFHQRWRTRYAYHCIKFWNGGYIIKSEQRSTMFLVQS